MRRLLGVLTWCVLWAACRSAAPGEDGRVIPAPAAAPNRDSIRVLKWSAEHTPDTSLEYRLRWSYQTEKGRTRGTAVVQVAPPDSLRFDYRAPLGRRGAAVIIGPELKWASRPDDVEKMIRVVPLFWSALGIPLSHPSAQITTDSVPDVLAWTYEAGDSTLTYVRRTQLDLMLTGMISTSGRPFATSFAGFADSTWMPTRGRIQMMREGTLLAFTVESIDTLTAIDAGRWVNR